MPRQPNVELSDPGKIVLRGIEAGDGFVTLRAVGFDAQYDCRRQSAPAGIGCEDAGRNAVDWHVGGGDCAVIAGYDDGGRAVGGSRRKLIIDLRRRDEKLRSHTFRACAVFDLDRRAAQRRRQSARGQLRAYRRTRAESRDYGRSKAIVIADVVGGDLYVYEPSPRRCDRRCTQRLPTVESFIQFLFLRPVFLFAAITGQVMWNSITVT